MHLALAVLAGLSSWIPARWQSSDPKTLDLLAGTPVNCVLIESSFWTPEFIREAARRGIGTLGIIHPGSKSAEQASRAVELKLNGLVLDGDFDDATVHRLRSQTSVIELPSRDRIRLDSSDPVLGTSQALWPGIEIEHGGAVVTGPTSAPWVYTNGGFLRFVRAATNAAL